VADVLLTQADLLLSRHMYRRAEIGTRLRAEASVVKLGIKEGDMKEEKGE